MNVSAIFSIILPIVGFAIFWNSIAVTRANADYGHAALLGFITWTLLSLGGIGLSIYSMSQHKRNKAAIVGLIVGVVPFLFIFYTILINSR